jgi:hypothetical protein
MDSLKLQTNGSVKDHKKENQKTNFNDLEFDYYGETVMDTKPQENKEDFKGNSIAHLNGGGHQDSKPSQPKTEAKAESENEPSVEEIRAQWKMMRSKDAGQEAEKKKKTEDAFNSEAFFESLLKKHEKTIAGEEEGSKEDVNELEERLNEEIVWALQQKIQAEQEAQQKLKPIQEKPSPVSTKPPVRVEAKKPVLVSEPVKPVEKVQPSMDRQLADIEQKLMAKKDAKTTSTAGLVMSTKMKEKLQREQEERELRDLENAINEEIR